MQLGDLVKAQAHVVGLGERRDEALALLRRGFGDTRPAVTVVGVSDLNRDDYLVEVSAVAAAGGVARVGEGGVLGGPQAVRTGSETHIAGQMAPGAGDVVGQCRAALERFCAVVREAGSSPDRVVATHIFLVERPEPAGFEAIFAAHREAFAGGRPTATMVYVPALPVEEALVQIAGVTA